MKRLVLLLSVALFTNNLLAEVTHPCKFAYQQASKKLAYKKRVITTIGSLAGPAVGISIGGGLGGLVGIGMAWSIQESASRPWNTFNRESNNKYDKILKILIASGNESNSSKLNEMLNDIIDTAIRKSGNIISQELRQQAKQILSDAFNDETFCPVNLKKPRVTYGEHLVQEPKKNRNGEVKKNGKGEVIYKLVQSDKYTTDARDIFSKKEIIKYLSERL